MQQTLDRRQVRMWTRELRSVQERIARRFSRKDLKRRAETYVRGLLGEAQRKNGWQLAESAGDERPYGIQHLLGRASWDADAVRDDLQEYVVEHLAETEAVLVVDETGFLKKGGESVGVGRQYSGAAGRVENCQIGVFLCYASKKGTAFVDRELYLPRDWGEDAERRTAAEIPEGVSFSSKPQIAQQMLARAFEAEIPAGWVTADSVYGDARRLLVWLETEERPHVMALSGKAYVWAGFYQHRVSEILEGLREDLLPLQEDEGWRRLPAGVGSKGERLYDWVRLRLNDPLQEGFQRWLLVRRKISDPKEMTAYAVFAPIGTSLQKLVRVAGSRWAIEAGFEAAKGEVGLGHYEVRSWHGWYRHITLSLLAHAFLSVLRRWEAHRDSSWPTEPMDRSYLATGNAGGYAYDLIPLTVPEVRHLLWLVALRSPPSSDLVLAWSHWRRRHQAIAKSCHYRARRYREIRRRS